MKEMWYIMLKIQDNSQPISHRNCLALVLSEISLQHDIQRGEHISTYLVRKSDLSFLRGLRCQRGWMSRRSWGEFITTPTNKMESRHSVGIASRFKWDLKKVESTQAIHSRTPTRFLQSQAGKPLFNYIYRSNFNKRLFCKDGIWITQRQTPPSHRLQQYE